MIEMLMNDYGYTKNEAMLYLDFQQSGKGDVLNEFFNEMNLSGEPEALNTQERT